MTTVVRFLFVCCCLYAVSAAGLKEEFTWKFINYAWPDKPSNCVEKSSDNDFVFPSDPPAEPPKYFKFFNRMKEIEEDVPEYIADNNIPMGTNHYKNKIFITVPRRRLGIPATLSYVSLDCKGRENVPLTPYPSWELNALNSPRPEDPADPNTPFVSVYRTATDVCNRLWFVDTGILEYPTGRQQVQPGALVVIDLKTDKVLRRYPFPESDVNARSTLADVTVDVTKNNCDDAYAYIPDLVNNRLVVYSWREQTSWVVNHNYFSFNPRGGEFFIGGFNFQWNDGVFSVALSKQGPDGYRTAYFHAMASTEEFAVSTKVLRNRTLASRRYHANDFRFIGDRGVNGQSSSHDIHQESGIMFLGEVNKNGLTCWNTNTPFSKNTLGVVQLDPNRMIYPGDVRVDMEGNVWMMTNTMPVFLYGKLDYQQVNFRIWTNSVRDAIKGTPCQNKRK